MKTIVCSICALIFRVCRSCFKGHKYCSADCKVIGYRLCSRRANRKYDSSIEAKLDHRDRSRSYRERVRNGQLNSIQNVTDKSSAPASSLVEHLWRDSCCIVCGRPFAIPENLNENLELQFFDTD